MKHLLLHLADDAPATACYCHLVTHALGLPRKLLPATACYCHQVAHALGLSGERVRQLEVAAHRNVRMTLDGWEQAERASGVEAGGEVPKAKVTKEKRYVGRPARILRPAEGEAAQKAGELKMELLAMVRGEDRLVGGGVAQRNSQVRRKS